MRSGYPFQVGDWIEVKSAPEVLKTLDHQASLDDLLFMPEMVQHCGRRFQVAAPVQPGRRRNRGLDPRRMADTVNLGTRCDGSGHDGCGGGCLMLWKAAWLTAVDGPAADGVERSAATTAHADRLAEIPPLPMQYEAAVGGRCQFGRPGPDTGTVPGMATLRHLADETARHGLLPKFLRRALGNGAKEHPAARGRITGEIQNDPDGAENLDPACRTAMAGDAPIRTVATARRFAIKICSDLSAVTAEWEELEQEATAFHTRGWLLPLYRILAPKFNATPLFVTVCDRDSNRPLMLLPLCIRRKWGLIVIEFADFGITDYNAPLLSPELNLNAVQAQELWDNICACLPPADIMLFDKIPETVSGRLVPLDHLKWVKRMDMRAWAISLPKTRDEYDKTIPRPKDRKEQRRKRRHLTDCAGELTLVHAATEREGREIFQAFRKQRQVRYKQTGFRDILDDPVFLSFWETVTFESWDRLVALSALKARDRIVATLLALRHNNNYLLVAHCFESIAEGLSPGIVAIDEMVTHLIGSGTKTFDFTIGNEGYKRQFGVEASLLYDGICPLSPQGWLFLQAVNAKRRFKAAVYPRITACRCQVRDQWKMLAQGDWNLIRRARPGDGCTKQDGPPASPARRSGHGDAGCDHVAGKAQPKPARSPDLVT
jgi:CelD/BcsL family acetyltransferase involved in cellulose biosynthesis